MFGRLWWLRLNRIRILTLNHLCRWCLLPICTAVLRYCRACVGCWHSRLRLCGTIWTLICCPLIIPCRCRAIHIAGVAIEIILLCVVRLILCVLLWLRMLLRLLRACVNLLTALLCDRIRIWTDVISCTVTESQWDALFGGFAR